MRFDRRSIMAPIGEPLPIRGLNPIFRRPEPIATPPINVPPPIVREEPISIGGISNIPTPMPIEQLPFESPRDDFLSIQRLDDPIMRPLPVGPKIPFVPPPQPPVLPRPIPAPVLPPVFNQPLAPAPTSIMGQPLSGADLELARSSGRGGLKGAFDNFQEFIAENPDKIRQGGGFLGGVDLTGESLRRAYDEGRGVLQRPTIPPRRDDFMSIERIGKPRDEFIPPVAPPPVSIGGPPLDTSLIPEREILERPIIPPSRGIIGSNPIIESGTGGIGARPDLPQLPRSSLFGGKGMRDDFMSIERIGNTDDMARLPGPPLQATPAPVLPPVVTPEPIIEPAPTTPAAVAPDVGAVPTPTMPMGAIDPVLTQQATAETLTDPLIRSLYFGTQDSPGFFQQLQQAGANLIGSDVPLQQTAGLTPLELLARQQAVAGIGGFEPFLQQNRDLVNQAIEQSRRAEQLQDPYYTQAEDIYRDTMGSYDPSMTQQFYNPFEDAVVQQTIEDVMKAGDKQDIAARAREISAGAFGGSRARLGAEERRQDLGEGLAKALGQLRQQGFSEAQRTGLSEFARQQQAKRTGAQGLIGIGTGRGSAAGSLAQRLAGFGGELTGLGRTQEQLRSGQRSELAGFGSTGRGIQETGLGRIFEQQVGQQFRPIQTLGQIGSMLPGYQASKTQIDSQYGMPTDPTAAGLGAAFSAYGALAPRPQQGSS